MAKKVVVVTAREELDDMWGAVECFESGGPEAVIDLILEDISAFLENAIITVELTSRPDASDPEEP